MKNKGEITLKHGIINGESKYLFVFSHMRSRSSVLSHILGSNEGVCGYSELHNSYVSQIDIMKMRVKLYIDLKCDLKGKYLLDKILHNNLEVSTEVISAITSKIIFLIRDPESTLKSIINMGYITGIDWYKNPEKASKYYCSRLSRLVEYSKNINNNYYFLESDDLVNNTDYVLSDLTRWLGLDSPLVNEYMEFKNTGKSYYGDPSDNIRARKLIKTKGYPDIEVPPEVLKIAELTYEKCRASLRRK